MRMHHRPMQFSISTLVRESKMISGPHISVFQKLGKSIEDTILNKRFIFLVRKDP